MAATQNEVGDVSDWLWAFVDHQTPNNDVIHYRDAPAQTEISQKTFKNTEKRGLNLLVPQRVMRLCKRWNGQRSRKSLSF